MSSSKNLGSPNPHIKRYIESLMVKHNTYRKSCKNKKLEKLTDEHVCSPTYSEYFLLDKYNYNASQLKQFAKNYKLKITGNKTQLIDRIYNHLYLSCFVLKIQKFVRGGFQRKYNKCHGPAFLNRSLCTNTSDFFTMDDTKDIEVDQFFSYKDDDGFVYGFDIISLYNLIHKGNSNTIIKNPYNRNAISKKVMDDFRTLLRLSKILKKNTCVEIKNIITEVSQEKSIELRALTLFQEIDSLGNYSNPAWFLSLNRTQLIKLVKELVEIWAYRAQMSVEIQRLICPPLGDPFHRMPSFHLLQTLNEITEIQKNVLSILEKMVNSAISRDNKALGACYVLGALTLVNNDAASALPWLYQSFAYFN